MVMVSIVFDVLGLGQLIASAASCVTMLRQPAALYRGLRGLFSDPRLSPASRLAGKLSFKVAANPPSPSGICTHGLLLTIKIRG